MPVLKTIDKESQRCIIYIFHIFRWGVLKFKRGRYAGSAPDSIGKMKRGETCLAAVGLFACAMAYLESAVVIYLRALYGIEDLLRDITLVPDEYTLVEIGREMATLAMLALIGWIAGRRRQDRIGYALFAFGLWDIFYYGWLYVLTGWPETLLDWDLLFLIPLPWWGPVLSPMLISLMLITGGGLAVFRAQRSRALRFGITGWGVAGASMVLALYVFMRDALHALPGGLEALIPVRPTAFNWPLFLIALTGMAFVLLRGLMPQSDGGIQGESPPARVPEQTVNNPSITDHG
jgi:hypothetical protein